MSVRAFPTLRRTLESVGISRVRSEELDPCTKSVESTSSRVYEIQAPVNCWVHRVWPSLDLESKRFEIPWTANLPELVSPERGIRGVPSLQRCRSNRISVRETSTSTGPQHYATYFLPDGMLRYGVAQLSFHESPGMSSATLRDSRIRTRHSPLSLSALGHFHRLWCSTIRLPCFP